MNKRYYVLALIPALILAVGLPFANAQGDHRMIDKVADKVIAHYQGASCEQLMAKKMQPPSPEEAQKKEKLVNLLHKDPAARTEFLNRVAGPIANKMFECGMIP
ncbi:hypothetical protein [Massilia horti]|uniref:Secreted protein n=1 Tax=Massilia horti TaxID=2562153 RepID=A0A4Y9T3Z2_9BURK|nr:hypothetical protein [Massilia horti]TFW34813.1 hypothetical protein E4O92_02975 [Massilia horti]